MKFLRLLPDVVRINEISILFSSLAFDWIREAVMGSRRLPKTAGRICWTATEASKVFYGYPQAGVSSK